MKKSVSWTMVAIGAFLAAGCSAVDMHRGAGYGSMPAPYGLDGKPTSERKPTTAGVRCRNAGSTCTIEVKVSDPLCSEASIELDEYVLLPSVEEKKTVVWKLPAGYVFCPRAGDGAFAKNPNLPDDLYDPVHKPRCSDEFQWNRKRADGQDFEYLLRFRSAARVCTKDPWMRNG